MRRRATAAPPASPTAPDAAALAGLAAVGGALVLLSFPPFGWGWLMWFGAVPLFAVHERLRPAALLAYAYAMAFVPVAGIAFCVLAHSATTFAILTATVSLAFALGITAAAAAEARLASPWARILVFPCAAIALEFGLGSETVRVPVTFALTQTDYPLVIQSADLFGTAGVTFLLILVNRSWPVLWQYATYRLRGGTDRPRLAPALLGLGLLVLNVIYGEWAIARHGAGEASRRIAAVQPAIPTTIYASRGLDPAAQRRIDATVDDLTRQALATAPALLVLSEGGNGRYNFRIPALRRRLEETARQSGAGLLVSSPDMNPAGEQYNAIFSLAPDGGLLGTYRKRLLTPVGEEYLTRGDRPMPLPSVIGPVGAMVCFESCFSGIARALVQGGAEYLFVSSSDAAFRNSALALLHSRFSVFRAIETRRYLVQADNTGPSLVVRPTGEIEAMTPFLGSGVLAGQVGARDGVTHFVALGPVLPLAAIGWLATALLRSGLRRRAHPVRPPPPTRVRHWGLAGSAAGYLVMVVFLAGASVHLASRGTAQDRGALANLAAFLAADPPIDVRQGTLEYQQHQANTCGPAALAFVLHTYGMEVSESEIAARAALETRGTNMLELVHAAEHLGLRAWGERLNLAALRRERNPTIAWLPRTGHFVVVLGVEDRWVYLFDPAKGPIKLAQSEFARLWNGYVLQVRFAPIPEIDGPASVAAAPVSDRLARREDGSATATRSIETVGVPASMTPTPRQP